MKVIDYKEPEHGSIKLNTDLLREENGVYTIRIVIGEFIKILSK